MLVHRITRWSLDAYSNGKWNGIAANKQSIGYKRLLKFTTVTASQVRLRITEGKGCPAIHTFGIYKSSFAPLPVVESAPRLLTAGNRTMATGDFRLRGNRLLLPAEFAGRDARIEIFNPARRVVWRGMVREDGVKLSSEKVCCNRILIVRCCSGGMEAGGRIVNVNLYR